MHIIGVGPGGKACSRLFKDGGSRTSRDGDGITRQAAVIVQNMASGGIKKQPFREYLFVFKMGDMENIGQRIDGFQIRRCHAPPFHRARAASRASGR